MNLERLRGIAIHGALRFRSLSKRLTIVSDEAGWVLDAEARELCRTMSSFGWKVHRTPFVRGIRGHVFFTDHFTGSRRLQNLSGEAKASMAYFHGMPGTAEGKFDGPFSQIRKYGDRIHRVQVTHDDMAQLCLEAGLSPDQVRKIVIPVNTDEFFPASQEERKAARKRYEIPDGVTVIGSFQKDGEGWGEGEIPKLEKGPDQFLEVVDILRFEVPDLFVLLSGPARGFVKNGLDQMGVPYAHRFLSAPGEVAELYKCIDLYIVASRQEGGPKAVLDSMATGVPVVSTAVGQAQEVIKDGWNGFLAPVEDMELLAAKAMEELKPGKEWDIRRQNALSTAMKNSYRSVAPLWKAFFEDIAQ